MKASMGKKTKKILKAFIKSAEIPKIVSYENWTTIKTGSKPNKHNLLAQSQQWKHQKIVQNQFKVFNGDTGTTSLESRSRFYLQTDFRYILVFWNYSFKNAIKASMGALTHFIPVLHFIQKTVVKFAQQIK